MPSPYDSSKLPGEIRSIVKDKSATPREIALARAVLVLDDSLKTHIERIKKLEAALKIR